VLDFLLVCLSVCLSVCQKLMAKWPCPSWLAMSGYGSDCGFGFADWQVQRRWQVDSISLTGYLSGSLPCWLAFWLSGIPVFCLLVRLPVRRVVRMLMSVSVYWSVGWLSGCLAVCLSVRLSVCLPACLLSGYLGICLSFRLPGALVFCYLLISLRV
jgi:hypothetical protein